jgi:hypothetical protein
MYQRQTSAQVREKKRLFVTNHENQQIKEKENINISR